METGKTGKYLKYAIGEIILVVIGILIALSINNWNETRKNHMILTSNLQGILEELKLDSSQIAWSLDFFTESNKNRIAFINHTNYEWFTRDSLEQSVENFVKELNMEYIYYQKIRNSGITEYGVYEEIMDDVINYYDYFIPFINKSTAVTDSQVAREDEYWRYEQKTYEFNYVEGLNSAQNEEVAKKELIELINSVTARNILKIDVRRNNYMIEYLTPIQTHLKEMILNLEKVLQQ